MSLVKYRGELLQLLMRASPENEDAILHAVDNWFTAFKDWERSDTFAQAFRDKRMTARTMKYVTEHTPLSMTRVSEHSRGKQEMPDSKSDTGIKGLMLRMDPANFVGPESGPSHKYDLGLHDMSSSLLHPDRRIGHQLFGWGFQTDSTPVTNPQKSYYVVFHPLPEENDMVTFNLLSMVAKEFKVAAPTLYATLRNVRSQMTRIKYADKDDSHIGFAEISARDAPRRKFRYGLKNSDAEAGILDSPTRLERASAAMRYKSILETAKERATRVGGATKEKFYNEIIVAYRSHDSETFPLFTRYAAGVFRVVHNNGESLIDVMDLSVSDTGVTVGF